MFKSRILNSEQIDYIRENYGYLRTLSMAEKLGVSERYVQKIAAKLGVVDKCNKYVIRGDTAYILCVGLDNSHKYFMIDNDDLGRVLSYGKWFLKDSKTKKYVMCNKSIQGKRTVVRLHRFLLGFPEGDIDHVDGNPLNNKKSNLRLCSDSLNMSNLQRCRVDNRSSKLLNVTYVKRLNRYRPELTIRGKYVCFKTFKTKEEAFEVIEYVRANFLPYSQEALRREYINNKTSKNIKDYVNERMKKYNEY